MKKQHQKVRKERYEKRERKRERAIASNTKVRFIFFPSVLQTCSRGGFIILYSVPVGTGVELGVVW